MGAIALRGRAEIDDLRASNVVSSIIIVSDANVATSETVQFITTDLELLGVVTRYIEGGGNAQSLFRVEIDQIEGGRLPAVHGSYDFLLNGLQFVPHFPFERGLSFRASFDCRSLSVDGEDIVLHFSFPKEEQTSAVAVQHVYPSGHELPENLLRFYVQFTHPMQRGLATQEIVVLGPDGSLAEDALYRAPVELWDNTMRYLTVLLDPGRLKRGVGPNRELGSPLRLGEIYTLMIGSNMTDASGGRLSRSYSKEFRVGHAVREPIDVGGWRIALPQAQTFLPLVISFTRSLDRALLASSLSIVRDDGDAVRGRATIESDETQWSFQPTEPWLAGRYDVRVAWGLEDVCGNGLVAPFDRSIRPGSDLIFEVENRSVSFDII